MTRRALGFVIGITAAFAFVRRLLTRRRSSHAARTMSDEQVAQVCREMDNCAAVGDAPAVWLKMGNMQVLQPNLDPESRVWFSRN